MKTYLCARDDELFKAWKMYCGHHEFVIPTQQDIMSVDAEAIVSPANSFGFMTGGIDLLYKNYFGQSVEDDLKYKIAKEFDNELLVGQATSIKLSDALGTTKHRYLIVAPTMRVPENVSHTINAFLAAKAAIIEAMKLGLSSIVFPGLGTGTGCMLPEDCAKQMNAAINYIFVDKRTCAPPKDLYEEQRYMREKIVSNKWLQVQLMHDIKYNSNGASVNLPADTIICDKRLPEEN
jgi:O-acetyl-ADP-ribose deacetylase (regulator of RNase III)